MADQSSNPTTPTRPGTPRWVVLLGISTLALVLVVAGVMIVSGGNHGPGMHNPAAGQASPSVGSVGGAGIGGPANQADATRTVEITTLDTMAYEPSAITVSIGEVVTFVVTNDGRATHEFTIGDTAMQQEHEKAMAHMPDGMTHALPNSIAIQPGETKQLTWRFGDAGALEFGCHEPGHYGAGMHGQIAVT